MEDRFEINYEKQFELVNPYALLDKIPLVTDDKKFSHGSNRKATEKRHKRNKNKKTHRKKK